MTLAFRLYLNGTPTHFPYKILNGLVNEELIKVSEYRKCVKEVYTDEEIIVLSFEDKIHTIREDNKNKWKAGNLIHFVINNRTENRYQFAPVVKCVSTQEIIIHKWYNKKTDKYDIPMVFIDDNELTKLQIKELAINDGFESVAAFFEYFNTSFKGKIIHWTDKKY